MVDWYEILGVPEDADTDTIKSVYRQLARTFHPDVNADPQAVEHFRRITEAFTGLCDPERRARHDRERGRRERPLGTESEARLGLRVAGIDLGGLLGVSVRMRTRPLVADDLDDEEPPPRLRRGQRR